MGAKLIQVAESLPNAFQVILTGWPVILK